MKRLKNLTAIVLLVALALLSWGCGTKIGQPTTPDNNTTTTTPEVSPTTPIAVYYLKFTDNEEYLVREVHQVEKTTEVAAAALNELINGNPVTPGAARVLPPETKVLGIKINQGLATVDFSADVLKANVGASGEALGIASIVNTLTEFPNIQRVSFTVEGQVDKAMDWWGHVGLSQQPFQRDLANVNEPAIWVTSPATGQVITSPVEISGNARVFEATVNYRLKDAQGNVLAEGHANASQGAPGRGDFKGQLAFTTSEPGKGQLEVFEVSMKDGSDRNKVVIPVEWQ
ncbi:MAG: Gmad2 immunoglobulin-like domain-containing protein [Syntrophomonadaceae bacterium]|nr:Gmad2 immunoglobulin-like domain-containing protein [Syntrophomonadaceae bacterium]